MVCRTTSDLQLEIQFCCNYAGAQSTSLTLLKLVLPKILKTENLQSHIEPALLCIMSHQPTNKARSPRMEKHIQRFDKLKSAWTELKELLQGLTEGYRYIECMDFNYFPRIQFEHWLKKSAWHAFLRANHMPGRRLCGMPLCLFG